ncbi:MAG: non-hydrolyzing UDP-N-acetylglucosamine 2-epimerase [Saprospiraceae bacterium]
MIALLLGTRPNFIKYAALHRAAEQMHGLNMQVVHTGQHSDPAMSSVFWTEFGLPAPDVSLGIAGGNRGLQIARTTEALVNLWENKRPDKALLIGDVNASVAGALAADALDIPVIHYEAGLRSFDRRMPEERNRIVMDALSTSFLCTEVSGSINLLREGHSEANIHLVGNLLADVMLMHAPAIASQPVVQQLGLAPKQYALVTLHRPSNVDSEAGLTRVLELLRALTNCCPVVFPVHPRTRMRLDASGWGGRLSQLNGMIQLDPLPWMAFQALQQQAALVVTDSGCVQEETTISKTPCLTWRENTERPITVEMGTNVLSGSLDVQEAGKYLSEALSGRWKAGQTPPLWEGGAGRRVWEMAAK